MLSDVVVEDAIGLSSALASILESEIERTLADRGSFALAVSGGSIATAFFPALARVRADWSRVDFFWIDERAVPPDDPESNYGITRSLWLAPAGVPAARIHRMRAEEPDLETAAMAYVDELVRVRGVPPRLDFVLSGVGPDGHVASLFPGHPLLREEARWAVAIHDAPKPPPRRLTLTMPVLATAGRVVIVALGESKAEAMRAALQDPESALPVALLIRRAAQVTVMLDRAAGSRLDAGPVQGTRGRS